MKGERALWLLMAFSLGILAARTVGISDFWHTISFACCIFGCANLCAYARVGDK